jgi:hypothetical protein
VSADMLERLETTIFSYLCHNRWRKLVFRIWPWNQEAESGKAHATVSKTKESSQDEIKNQDNDLFFSILAG